MKNIILTKIIFIILLVTTNSFASLPNIPKEINQNNFCDNKGGKHGHVIVILDLTTKLDQARIEFIKNQVFSEEFYLSYKPFTKFSYFLIDNNEPTKQKFLFSKCRPKTGDKNFSKLEKASFFENKKVLENYSNRFFDEGNKLHNKIFTTKKHSKYSYIYETIAYIFQNPKSDFGTKHSKRELIVVSDLMQNTERLSFYKACNATSGNAKCPSFNEFMKNLSDKDYILATSPKGNGIDLKLVYLNNRCETNKSLDKSLKVLWEDYFESRNFNLKNTIHQTDINNKLIKKDKC
tara:strand:- start:1504 stop:2379 length:876 start_codon:yes stop_codon:yes gene_type:complete